MRPVSAYLRYNNLNYRIAGSDAAAAAVATTKTIETPQSRSDCGGQVRPDTSGT